MPIIHAAYGDSLMEVLFLAGSFATMPPVLNLFKITMKLFLYGSVLCLFSGFLEAQNPQERGAVLIFTGDLNFAHRFEQAAAGKQIDVFARWKNIGAYDLMMVNLENAVTRSADSVKKEFVFKMKPEYLQQFRGAGISLVNCANNHTADFGIDGIFETIRWLDSAGIYHTGIGRNLEQAREPVILTIQGIRIGFLGYGSVQLFSASRTRPGTVPRKLELILEDIRKIRQTVDYIVINLHWGVELETEPESSQIALAHAIIREGADVIIGHHPHVLQGVEQYRGKVVAYSLGNYIFGGNSKCVNSETAVLRARFTKDTMEVNIIPVSIRNWQPVPAESVESNRTIRRIQERSKIFFETIPKTSYRRGECYE